MCVGRAQSLHLYTTHAGLQLLPKYTQISFLLVAEGLSGMVMALMQRSLQVAGVSGDVRRVLQLSRKAAEICEEEKCQQARLFTAVRRSLSETSQCCPPECHQADPMLWPG